MNGTMTVYHAAKGGSGTTVTVAALGVTTGTDTLLVDLDGDLLDVLGMPGAPQPGLSEWLDSTRPADTLDTLLVDVTTTTRLLPAGTGSVDRHHHRLANLAEWLLKHPSHVIVDAGTGAPPPPLVEQADRVLLVSRPCYLALRHAHRSPRPDGIVLIREPGRALTARDVEATLGAPVVTTLNVTADIARAVDAGLLLAAVPRGLRRALHAIQPADPTPPPQPVTIDGHDRHGRTVTVDVQISDGPPGYIITNTPDGADREHRDRIRAAIVNSGYHWPDQTITVTIPQLDPTQRLPADTDVPIAIGILAASGQLDPAAAMSCSYTGELGLDGTIYRPPGEPDRRRETRDTFYAPPAVTLRHLADQITPAARPEPTTTPHSDPPDRPQVTLRTIAGRSGPDYYDQVHVNVQIGDGHPGIHVHGMPLTHAGQAIGRIRQAIISCGYRWPGDTPITISLDPPVPVTTKHDLPIAVGILAATGQITLDQNAPAIWFGDLSPNGDVAPADPPAVPGADALGWSLTELRAVGEIDYGSTWTDTQHPNEPWRLTYNPDNGQLTTTLRSTGVVEVLGSYPNRSAVEQHIAGWEHNAERPGGLDWLRAITHSPAAALLANWANQPPQNEPPTLGLGH
jgi:hypothetical protein